MKDKTVRLILFLSFFILGLLTMSLINNILGEGQECDKKEYDGCWASIKSGDNKGDWVCVNVQDMSFKRAVEVCKHEVGHEIFAEICERDIDKCMKVVESD